jgi:hypothetical protein
MKKSSKRYTCYGMCYCDCTPLLLLGLILAKLAHVFQQLIGKNLQFEFAKTTFELQTKKQNCTWVQAWAWWAMNVFT